MADFDLDILCRNLAAALAAGFTTFVVASWSQLGERQVELAGAVLAVWVVLGVQAFHDRRLGAGR